VGLWDGNRDGDGATRKDDGDEGTFFSVKLFEKLSRLLFPLLLIHLCARSAPAVGIEIAIGNAMGQNPSAATSIGRLKKRVRRDQNSRTINNKVLSVGPKHSKGGRKGGWR
jgi:hypothetical protein